MTCVWQVLIEWKDENTTWMDLCGVKETKIVKMYEYAIARKINDESAFAW